MALVSLVLAVYADFCVEFVGRSVALCVEAVEDVVDVGCLHPGHYLQTSTLWTHRRSVCVEKLPRPTQGAEGALVAKHTSLHDVVAHSCYSLASNAPCDVSACPYRLDFDRVPSVAGRQLMPIES